jgi:metal-responsive CopG/Arc/MetJ family transcriptional regulator
MSPENMTERFEMRLGQSVLEKVDAWRAGQSDVPSRSEAVRRLVETGGQSGR